MELNENLSKVRAYRERAAKLVAQMTTEEKVGQVLYQAPSIDRLGIKAYNWWNEALHGVARAGVATIFPQAIGLAATFDEDFVEEVAEAISTEGRAKFEMQQRYDDTDIYKGLTFWSPNVNIFRDPRWGRGHETFGEDPYLASRLGVRFVRGLQGHDENYLKAAACAKHFAVHSGPEDLRHSFNAEVTLQDLYETYLPAFEACVKEGHVEAVMGAYNRTNGEPCSGSRFLLQDILRKKWNFQGHVVSDCWAIKDYHEGHHVTETPVASAAMAMNNGCDLNCGNMFHFLGQAIDQGMVSMKRLDEALINLFTARMKLGVLGEDPQAPENPYCSISYTETDNGQMQALNREAAARSIVLLKNQDGLLPLHKEKLHTVGVIGPNANNRKALVGNYEGTASRYYTILEGIQDYLGDDARVFYSEGCHLWNDRLQGLAAANDRLSEVKAVCENSDVIIACMGLDADLEGEEGDQSNEFAGGDKPNLELPGLQQQVLETICSYGKPVVLLLLAGSALAINWADEHIPAIVECWYPGAQGGKSVADILFGAKNPEGKLPVTFYRTSEELPAFTDYNMKGRTYRYMEQEALYPFGYGLSYTEFTYEQVTALKDQVDEEGLIITGNVKNVGAVAGGETVQTYIKINKKGTPNPQLKNILKLHLNPGEEKSFTINIPRDAFGLYDEEGEFQIDSGTATVYVGGQGADARSAALTGKSVISFQVQIL